MKYLFLFLFCIPYAFAKNEILLLKTDSEKIEFVQLNQKYVTKDCIKKSCLALQKPKTFKLSKVGPWVQNPSALFCESNGGSYFVGTRENGNEDGICRFKDQSAILAWDFYLRNKK